MKKLEFYSMMYKNGKKQAVKHEGYTDGTYNYYKNFSTWHAIAPAVGLSIIAANTRKEAQKQAQQLNAKVKERLQGMQKAIEEFTRCQNEAAKEEVKQCI